MYGELYWRFDVYGAWFYVYGELYWRFYVYGVWRGLMCMGFGLR